MAKRRGGKVIKGPLMLIECSKILDSQFAIQRYFIYLFGQFYHRLINDDILQWMYSKIEHDKYTTL